MKNISKLFDNYLHDSEINKPTKGYISDKARNKARRKNRRK